MNTREITEANIRKMKFGDLDKIVSEMEDYDKQHLINAITTLINDKEPEERKANARNFIGCIMEQYAYITMQPK